MKILNKIKVVSALSLIVLLMASFNTYRDDDKKKKKEPKDIVEMYSMGEIKVFSADSIPFGTYVALTKEVMNKKENKITMKSLSLDQKGEVTEYNYIMDVKDPKFTIHDVDGNYEGKGVLHGSAWKWTSWSYTIDFKNPVGKVDAYNYVSLVGLVVNKSFYGADGKLTVRYKERHKFITKEQFEILYLQIVKCSTK